MLLSQYIDDHHVGQMCLLQCYNSNWSDIDLAKAAVFIAPSVLVSCGYFIGLKKSILSPVQVIPFLGFLSDSTKQAFLLPEDKKLKFAALRDFWVKSHLRQESTKVCWEDSFILSSCFSCQAFLQGGQFQYRKSLEKFKTH